MSTEATAADEMPTGAPVEPLRLLAEDADDLHIISAALQDAIMRPVDIVWEPSARRVTLALSRFCWECGGTRVMAAMQFGDVISVKSRRLPRRRFPDDVHGAHDGVLQRRRDDVQVVGVLGQQAQGLRGRAGRHVVGGGRLSAHGPRP